MAAAISLYSTRAADLFWQLRTGLDIFLTGHPPHYDTYSWTRHGQPWVVNEWLSFLLFYEAFHLAGGFAGPLLLEQALLAVIALLLYFFLLRATNSPGIAFALALMSLAASYAFLEPRPFLFTFLFLIVTTGLCSEAQRGTAPAWTLWLLPPLFALWANLHQGVIVGIGFLITLALADFVESVWFQVKADPAAAQKRTAAGLQFGGLGLACFGASLVTPYGFGLYQMVFVTMRDQNAVSRVQEWMPPHLHPSPNDASLLTLAGLVILGLWRSRKEGQIGMLLFVALLSYEAVEHRRNVPLAVFAGVVLTAPLISPALREISGRVTEAWKKQRGSGSRQPGAASFPFASAACFVLSAICLLNTLSHFGALSVGMLSSEAVEGIARSVFAVDQFPGEACSFLRYERFPANLRLYNDYDIGGFLILRCPENPVFTDGRVDLYAGPLSDGALLIENPQPNQTDLTPPEKDFLRSYHFDSAITTYPLVAKFFAQQPDWSLVYIHHLAPIQDTTRVNAWVFLRHRPDLEPLIARSRSDWAARHHGVMPDPGL